MILLPRRTLLSLPLLGLAPASAQTPKNLAMVMNSGEASVSVIDMDARQVIATVPTFREPSHWALSPDRTRIYIADASGNALFILDPLTAAPLGHLRIADPYQLGYTPDQKFLAVNALRINHVDFYDAQTFKLIKRFSPGSMPSHLDFSPDSRWSFHSCQGSDSLVCYDLTTMTPRFNVKIGKTPAGVLWHENTVLVAIMGADHIVQADPQTGAVQRKIPTGIGAHNIFYDPAHEIIYVSNRLGGSLTALDAQNLTPIRTYPLPGGPDDIGIDPSGNLWVALRFAESVAILNPATGATTTIPVGRSPHGIFLNTELQKPGKLTAEVL